MNVAQVAYQEVWAWLDNPKGEHPPRPPEGMHELAVAEWWRGHDLAVEHHAKEEKVLDRWTSRTMWAIRIIVIFGATAAANWSGNQWIMGGVGIACLVYVWRMKI